MGWKNAVCYAPMVISIGAALLASAAAVADDFITEAVLPTEAAVAKVEEYRELRRNCADLGGEERRSCFRELHASNGEYRVAKQQLKLGQTADRENIHLVTF